MRKQYPKKQMEKIIRRREKRKRRLFPEKKPDKDKYYKKTKRLAKKLGIKFIQDYPQGVPVK